MWALIRFQGDYDELVDSRIDAGKYSINIVTNDNLYKEKAIDGERRDGSQSNRDQQVSCIFLQVLVPNNVQMQSAQNGNLYCLV